MAQVAAFLRGINVGQSKRIAMAQLRAALSDDDAFDDVRTYVASGNVVLASEAAPDDVARRVQAVIAGTFGYEVDVVTRTGAEMAAIVTLNPLEGVATDLSRSMVAFLPSELGADARRTLEAEAAAPERLVIDRREIYLWYPGGVMDSRLAKALTPKTVGMPVTVRNWNTVAKVSAMMLQP